MPEHLEQRMSSKDGGSPAKAAEINGDGQKAFRIDDMPQTCDSSREDSGKAETTEKKRRLRTSFTQMQLLVLEEAFSRQQYMVKTDRARLAASLALNQIQVKIWFQNRRIRWRKEQREATGSEL